MNVTKHVKSVYRHDTVGYVRTFLDSGAPSHATPSVQWSEDQRYLDTPIQISTGGHDPDPITMVVTEKLTFRSGREDRGVIKFNLKDVLVNEQLPVRLISEQRLVDAGITVEKPANQRVCLLKRNNKLLATFHINPDYGLYELIQERSTCFVQQSVKDLWHRRLHIGDQSLEAAIEQQNLKDNQNKSERGKCASCNTGKARKAPIRKAPKERNYRPGQVWSIDDLGTEIPTPGGPVRALTCVDVATGYLVPIIHKTKGVDYQIQRLKELLIWSKVQTENSCQTIISDNEIPRARKAKQLKAKMGFEFRTTEPYASEQNTFSERANGITVSDTRPHMVQSRQPESMTIYAYKYAVYIRNRLPYRGGASRACRFYQDPSISLKSVRTYGCLAYRTIINKKLRRKFGYWARPGTFIGFSEESEHYLILDNETKEIFKTRNVHHFDESTPGWGKTIDKILSEPWDGKAPPDVDADSEEDPHSDSESEEDIVPDDQGEVITSDFVSDPIITEIDEDDHLKTENEESKEELPEDYGLISDSEEDELSDASDSEIADVSDDDKARPVEDAVHVKGYSPTLEPIPLNEWDSWGATVDPDLILPDGAKRERKQRFQLPTYIRDELSTRDRLRLQHRLNQKDPHEMCWAQMEVKDKKVLQNDYWVKSREREMKAIMDNQTFGESVREVDLPKGAKLIGSRFVHTEKGHIPKSDPKHYKARLVAQNYGPNTDRVETFAPTPTVECIRFMVADAAQNGKVLSGMDFSSAYLNSVMPQGSNTYLRLPKGNGLVPDGHIVKLNKALYGLKEAGRLWRQTLTKALRSNGWNQVKAESCLFYKKINGKLYLVIIHVDDMLTSGPDSQGKDDLLIRLRKLFKIKDLGFPHHFLGVEFRKDGDGSIVLHQRPFIEAMIKKYGYDENVRRTTNPYLFRYLLRSLEIQTEGTPYQRMGFRWTSRRASVACEEHIPDYLHSHGHTR